MKTYIVALFCTLLAACAGSADGPVMAEDLHGTYCTTSGSEETCLLVDATTTPATYIWYVGDSEGNASCSEAGELTGGLEFWPADGSDLCLAPEADIYSASGEWTADGLRLELDASPGAVRAVRDGETRTLVLEPRP